MGFWLGLAFLWTVLSAEPVRFSLHRIRASFDEAISMCSPGSLASLSTEQDIQQIQEVLTEPNSAFWVGLRKSAYVCTNSELLRGFRWLDGSSGASRGLDWLKKPKETCVEILCAVLKHSSPEPLNHSLGLMAVSCKDQNWFICELTPTISPQKTVAPPWTRSFLTQTDYPSPQTSHKTKTYTEPKPTTIPTSQAPDTVQPSLTTLAPELMMGSGKAGDSCQQPTVPGHRFLRMFSRNSSRIQVECWSDITLDLLCSDSTWLMLDGSPANFSTICELCDTGFFKNGSGHCVDVNECDHAPCRSTEVCLNTEGSHECVCPTNSTTCEDPGNSQDTLLLSGVLVPVLVAVAVLLVLMVLLIVAFKCCLMRRKRAREKAERKEES